MSDAPTLTTVRLHRRSLSQASVRSEWSVSQLKTWRGALEAFDDGHYEDALSLFENLEERSKILFNRAICEVQLGSTQAAIYHLERALQADKFLSLASFHLGCLQYSSGAYRQAADAFNASLVVQFRLGPEVVLLSCDIHINLAASLFSCQETTAAVKILLRAWELKRDSHKADGNPSIVQCDSKQIFRPSALKLEGLETQEYLGTALVVAVNSSANLAAINQVYVKCSKLDDPCPDIVMIKLDAPDIRVLRHRIMTKFQLIGMWAFKIKYKDSEGDLITISDDDDFVRAIQGPSIRLYIQELINL